MSVSILPYRPSGSSFWVAAPPLQPGRFALQVVATSASGVVFLALVTPLVGALVRLRANYAPRRVQLPTDASATEEGEPGPVARGRTSYFGMLKRVHRIEGWAGMYKGIMPSIIESVLSIVLVAPILSLAITLIDRISTYPLNFHLGPTFAPFLVLIAVCLFVPLDIIKTRVITTPYKLPAFEPAVALRTILSPSERARPARLYALPGVIAATLLENVVPLVMYPIWLVILQLLDIHHAGAGAGGRSVLIILRYTACYFVGFWLLAFTATALTVLNVLKIRLSLQRFPAPAPASDSEVDTEEGVDVALYSATEDVLEVRTESDHAQYTSLKDAYRSVLAEEGARALLRGWWITALSVAPMFVLPLIPPLNF
ncbi:hypothetical protein HMN09_00553000 [Mycena chlorophos]|uniref:Mitochondrial carrier n=1 Tax=Mycena chlorophos TaxID=658473 RepID=A0A8H6TC00_MYCCL|nr:hypothetical protein HMN09_00553000 [Mycena chlorophos]